MLRLEKRETRSPLMLWLSPLLALLMTLIAGTLIFILLKRPPLESLYVFFILPISDWYGINELLVKATPLILCAAGLAFCFKARLWNIGAEGQFVMGALCGGAVALAFNDLSSGTVLAQMGLPISLIAGMLGGVLWSILAAALKTRFGCNEILTTIMLNYIALNLLLWAVHGPLKDPNGFNFPESALLNEHMLLAAIHPYYRTNISVIFPVLALIALWFVVAKTLIGFQIQILGESAKAARYAGFHDHRLVWIALGVSGALAGLAGVSEVTGQVGQVTPHLSIGYGYAAIIVVYLGRMHPLGILIAGLLLALTYLGGENLQIDFNLPKAISQLFQGLLLLFLLLTDLFISHRLVWHKASQNTLHGLPAAANSSIGGTQS